MPIPAPAEPEILQFTTWFNPTKRRAILDLFTQADRRNPSGRVRYIIEPGQEQTIPSTFDDAIQKRNDQGVIVQGKAPSLIRRGAPPAKIHPALDTETQEREAAERKAAAAHESQLRADAMAAHARRDADAAHRREAETKAHREAQEAQADTDQRPTGKRSRGRPKGSRNKPKGG